MAIHGDEGRLGSTFLPCCATPGGDWNGTFSSGRPGIPATSELGERYVLLTAAFDGDCMGLDVRIANVGQEDLDGVPFSRVGTCPVRGRVRLWWEEKKRVRRGRRVGSSGRDKACLMVARGGGGFHSEVHVLLGRGGYNCAHRYNVHARQARASV